MAAKRGQGANAVRKRGESSSAVKKPEPTPIKAGGGFPSGDYFFALCRFMQKKRVDACSSKCQNECMKSILAHIRLEEIAEVSAGHPIRGSVDALPVGPVSVVQMRDALDSHNIDWDGAARVTLPEGRREPDWLRHGDIILATRGRNNLATLVQAAPPNAVAAPAFFLIRVKRPETLLPEFLCWQMNQHPAQAYFQSEATGSHILNLRRSVVEVLPLAIPPLGLQRRIAEFASAAADEKHLLEQLILNRQRQFDGLARNVLQASGA